jgi:hypothetical protein
MRGLERFRAARSREKWVLKAHQYWKDRRISLEMTHDKIMIIQRQLLGWLIDEMDEVNESCSKGAVNPARCHSPATRYPLYINVIYPKRE